nr:solute carrier family 22 member 12-like [Rhipicephalus microplus]
MASSDKEQRAVVDQPFTALRVLPSSHDSQLESAQLSSGKDSEQATTKQPTSALTTSLPSRDDRHESFIIPSDEGATVSQPSTTLTSFLLSQNGRRREGFKMSATRGTEDERLAIHNASVKPTYERTSSLSSTEGHHEAARTSTVAAVMTAASVAAVAPTSPLDHVLICGHGRFQQIALFCTALAFFTTIVHAIGTANLARPVDHWCRPTVQYSYMEPNVWRNISIPVIQEKDGTERHSQCQRFEPPLPYAESSAGLPDNRSTVPCDAGWQYASGASSAHQRCNAIFAESHGHSIVDEWDLVCGRSWMVPALSATYVAGGVVGAPLAGIAADRMGRRPVLGIWLVLLVFAGTALVFANSVAVFTTLRFVTSVGAAEVLVASQVLLFEVTDSQHRVLFCAIAVAAAGFVAAVYTEVVYVFIRNWHAAQVAYMVPTCGLMVAAYLAEESPCWLMATYELRNAEHVLSRAAGANSVEPPVFRRRLSALRDEMCRQHCHSVTQQEQERANVTVTDQDGVRLSDLLSNQPLRQRSAIIFGCWFLAFGTFAHLSTGHMMRTSQGARTALVVLRLPCVVADVYVLTRNSRRLCLVFSMLSLAVVMGALSLAVSLDAADLVAAVLVTLALLVFDMSAISAFVLSAELYPTVLRGATFGVCYMSGRLGAQAAVFVNEIQSRPLRGVAYAITAAMLLLFGTMALALPETKHMPPSNVVHGIMVMEDKWQLYCPLRVARTRNKRRHSKTALLESDRMRRRSSSLLREQAALGRDPAAYK